MMTIEQIRDALRDRNLSKVSRASGVSYRVIWRIARGADDAGYNAVKRISDYLEGADNV